MQKVRRHFIS